MGVLVTVSQVVMVASVTRLFVVGDGPLRAVVTTPRPRLVLGASLLLLASSPFHHVWSRTAWDQLHVVVPWLVVAAIASGWHRRPWGRVAIGTLLGAGLSAHPNLVPVTLVLGAIVVLDGERRVGRVVARAAETLVPMVLVLAPWVLGEVLRRPPTTLAVNDYGTGGFATAQLFAPTTTASLPGFTYYAGPQAEDLHARLGGAWVDTAVVVVGLVWIVATIVGLWLGVHRTGRRRIVAGAAAAAALLHPLFHLALDAPGWPHYQWPATWVPYVAVVALLAAAVPVARTRWVAVAVVVVVAGAQVAYTAAFRDLVGDERGIRSFGYGVVLAEQERIVAEVCGTAGATPTVVVVDVRTLHHGFEYVAGLTPACSGVDVEWCDSGSAACPDPDGDTRRLRLVHAEDGTNRVAVRRVAEGHGALSP